MKSKVVSMSLISLFLSILALPLFGAHDDCDMPCCRVTVPCCETEEISSRCPTMKEEQDSFPVLVPSVPRPASIKHYDLPVVSSVPVSDVISIDSHRSDLDESLRFSASHTKIPLYFLHHSLLI